MSSHHWKSDFQIFVLTKQLLKYDNNLSSPFRSSSPQSRLFEIDIIIFLHKYVNTKSFSSCQNLFKMLVVEKNLRVIFFILLHSPFFSFYIKFWIEIDLKKWKRVSLLSNIVMKTEKYYWVLILVKIRIEQFFSKCAKICLSWIYKPTSLITLIVDKVNNQYECRWWEEKHCIWDPRLFFPFS